MRYPLHRTDREGTLRVLVSEAGIEVQAGIVAITPGVAAAPAVPPEVAAEPVTIDASGTRAGQRAARWEWRAR